jgi:hypothetical protein
MQDRESEVNRRYGETLVAGELESPAAERNKEPILAVLRTVLPLEGVVLEVASGTGQHAVHFARAFPDLVWQPSEPDATLRAAIETRVRAASLDNLRLPLDLDVLTMPWPISRAGAVVCINLIHIAPWRAAEALFEGAGALLAPGLPLILYGPYRRGGRHTAPSNEAFDASLRARNRDWGVRDLDDVEALANAAGFELAEAVEMPANNLTVVFAKRGR